MSLKTFLVFFLVIFFCGLVIFFKETIFDKFSSKFVDQNSEQILQQLEHAPDFYLDSVNVSSPRPISETETETCHFFNCFNIYRCVDHSGKQKRFRVHIPAPKRFLTKSDKNIYEEVSPFTLEFVEILEAISESEYYTDDPDQACIFVPALDLLNEFQLKDSSLASKALEFASPHWKDSNSGENHLLISFYPGSPSSKDPKLHLEHGRAMVAAAGLSRLTYRTGFDISLPTFSILQENVVERSVILSKRRKWFLLSPQVHVQPVHRPILSELCRNHSDQFVKMSDCSNEGNDKTCRLCEEHPNKVSYITTLADSTFCLILRNSLTMSNPALMEALHFGCIPVVAIDGLVLPFSEVLDWKRFSIRIHESDVPTIVSLLSEISEKRRTELKHQGSIIYEKYFSTVRALSLTTLDILNDRIFSHHAKNYLDWNVFPNLRSPLFLQQTAPASEGFTAVILTYDRLDSLFSVISRVAEVPSLSQIVVVWNNQEKSPPASDQWPKTSKPIRVVRTRSNKLSNRFLPFEEIETEAVLSMDDDIVMLTPDELEFGFQVWREFPDRLVGFPSRTHVWDNVSSRWRYESEWKSEVSMVLTGAAFCHKYWLHLFTESPSREAKEIKAWVDDHMNCEDLAMNFLIGNMTRKAPIKVAPRKKFKCSTRQCTNSDMLSGVQTHLMERSDCINMLAEKYGYMPLKAVEFRADPVLYKDNLPEKLKKFAEIGSL